MQTRANDELPHIVRGRERIEDLWAAGTDYCAERIARAREANALLHLDLDLTGNCQLKCFYCDRTPDRFSAVPDRRELTTQDRIALIREARSLGAETVEFPGAGEPMIDPGFWEIVETIHALGMTPVLFTSGYHLDRASIKRLWELGASIFLKHNSSDLAKQDKMVGVRGYGEKAQAALRMLIEQGFNSTIPTRLAIDLVVPATLQDDAEVQRIFRWCRENNVHNYIMTLIPEGLADRGKLLLERQRCDALLEMLQRIDEDELGLRYTPSRPMAGGYKCRQVNCGLFVNLFGEVYDCNGLSRIVGHWRRNSLEEIWNSRYARHIREPLQEGFCLVRERQWAGREDGAMSRKIEPYRRWSERAGKDEVAERAIDAVVEIVANPRGARPVQEGALLQLGGRNARREL